MPERSFFLFGPRGTGKTTWLRQELADALGFDLLRTQTFLELSQRPDLFRQQVEARPRVSNYLWRTGFGGPLKSLAVDRIVQSAVGVYTGARGLKDGPLRVLPVRTFLKELAAGNILG